MGTIQITTSPRLFIPMNLYLDIFQHCKSEFPYEAVGLLSGLDSTVKQVWFFQNERKSRTNYYVGIEQIKDVINQISIQKEELLAIFHSHPTARPLPSNKDIRHHPKAGGFMVIVSLQNNINIKAFQVIKESYKEVAIYIIE